MEAKIQMPAALAAGVAHEIRNPLNAIGLQLTLLERKLRDIEGVGQSVNDVIETVRRELRRLGSLTNEIIDFSKPIDLRRSWVNPAELIGKIEQIHGPSLAMMGVALETTITGEDSVYCDPGRIHQVLVNLLTNGIDALDGRENATIELTVDNRPRSTTFGIRDNGQGMNTTSRVFDLFYTTKASGTGMGLPVVRKIIEAHGGSVRVKSTPGEGTTFTLFLPRPAPEN
jgi:signal transduction histidine kinase